MTTTMLRSTVLPGATGVARTGAGACGRLLGDSFIYVCAGLESQACRHSVTLLQTLDPAELLQVETERGAVCGGLVLVAPQVPRVLRAVGVPFVLVDLEPSHPQYRRFLGGASAVGVMSLDHLECAALREIGQRFYRQTLSGTALDDQVRQAVAQLAQGFPKPPELDERVRWMMSAIDQDPSRSLTDLARQLSFSIEHASRLFSSQVGVGLRTYSLSNKIRYAARYLGRGLPLTEVAQIAGFVDSAHFAKVWTRCYGRPPSAFFPPDKTRMDEECLPGWNLPTEW